MGFIAREIGHFFVGIMFLTRLPVPSGLRQVEGRLARSARYFPLIGVLIGSLTALVFFIANLWLSPETSAAFAIGASLILTGALHEDGFADCCDGLGGGASREHALEIMQDSRLGTYGVAGLLVVLGLKWSVLAEFSPEQGVIALIVAGAVSRGMIPPVLVSSGYARSRGLASSVAGGVTVPEAAFATLLSLAIAMIAGPAAGLAAFTAAVLTSGTMLAILVRKLGGYTGDGLGAIQTVAEVTVLVFFAGYWR